jgi:hypothetical protein
MALESKQIQAIPLDTIGIDGIDTQTTATALGPNWFTKADNIVYTEGGKVAFRKGLKQKTLNGGAKVGSLVEHYDGTNYKVFAGVGTNMYEVDLSDKDNAWINAFATGASSSDWQFSNFNNELFVSQYDSDPLRYASSTWSKLKDTTGYTAPHGITTFDPSCMMGFYGRMWAGGITEEDDVLFYSKLLDGHKWGASDGGVIDLKSVWGHDSIIAIHPFAGKLVIFGKENIAIYNDPDTIANIALDEVIRGIGCVSRDSIQSIGDDLYFLSDTGVRSLFRTTQLDKLPLTEKSITIKDELIANINGSTNVKSAFMLNEGLYLLSFVDRNVTYVFDTTYKTSKETPRITKWHFTDSREPASMAYTETYGLLVGQQSGRVATYEGYYDVDYSGSSVYTYNSYTTAFATAELDLGQGVQASILKKLIMVIAGGQGTDVGIRLYKDFETTPKISPTFKLNPTLSGEPSYWGNALSLYGATTATHTHNSTLHPSSSKYAPIHGYKERSVPLSGNAKYIRIEWDAVTKGYKASLQSISLLFKQGKTL